jgi:Bacterial dnaA protein helix-turn-helix
MSRRWTNKEKRAFKQLWDADIPMNDMAVALGRSIGSIESMSHHLRWRGDIETRRRANIKWTPSLDKKIIAFALEGMSNKHIGEMIGAREDSVHHRVRILRRHGKLAADPPSYSGHDGDRITFKRLLYTVCCTYRVPPKAILGERVSAEVVKPRHVLMALARRHTRLSFSQIGERMSRDHTSVLHGARVAQAKYADDISAIELELFREAAE